MRSKLITLAVIGALGLQVSPTWADNLIETYQQAVDNDPSLKQAQYSRQAANENREQARAGFRPQVNLGATASQNRFSVQSNSTNYASMGYSLSLTQPLYHRDTYVNNDKAGLVVEQAEANLQQSRQDLMLRTAQAYFGVLAAQDNLSVAQAEQAAFAKQLEQANQRFKVGLNTLIDVNEAQAAHDNAVARAISADNDLFIAKERLREITARTAGALDKLPADIPLISPEPADPEQWAKTAIDNNIQLSAQRKQVELARKEVESARAGHYPTLDLVGNHRYTDQQSFGSTTIKEMTNTSLALQLNMPIYQGGMTDSRIRQSQLNLSAAQENYERLRRELDRSTRSAYLGVISGINRVQALKQSVVSSQSAVTATEAGVEVGTRTTVDVLNARKQLYAVQRDYAQARYNYVLSTLSLKQAAGHLTEDDLQQLNGWLK